MAEKNVEGFFTAYCPKFNQQRTIKAKLSEQYGLGGVKYRDYKFFNCPDCMTCEYFVKSRMCPFIVEAFSCFDR